jgi:putative ABC transport system permease protein
VGDTFTLTGGNRTATLKITGEVFDPDSSDTVLTNLSSVAALDPSGLSPQYDVGLRPGVNAQGYANAVVAKLGQNYGPIVSGNPLLNSLTGLIAILTLLLAAVAGLGVLHVVRWRPALERADPHRPVPGRRPGVHSPGARQ